MGSSQTQQIPLNISLNTYFNSVGTTPTSQTTNTKSLIDQILDEIELRAGQLECPFTWISDNSLLVLGTEPNLGCWDIELFKQFLAERTTENPMDWESSGGMLSLNTPHLFTLVAKSYLSMKRLGVDQTIIISGIGSSGKSQTYLKTLEYLGEISKNPKKSNLIHQKLLHLPTLLENFTNSKTPRNSIQSQMGLYQEIQFNQRGRLIGCKTLKYSLNLSPLFISESHVDGYCNYNIFYTLYYGCSKDLRDQVLLPPLENIKKRRLLYNAEVSSESINYHKSQFLQLAESIKFLGFNNATILEIFRFLTSLIYLGDLDFINNDFCPGESLIFSDARDGTLDKVCQLLGVKNTALEHFLTKITKKCTQSGDLIEYNMTPTQSRVYRDQLIANLYLILIDWILEMTNSQLCNFEADRFIAVLEQLPHSKLDPNQFGADKVSSLINYEQFLQNLTAQWLTEFTLNNLLLPQSNSRNCMLEDNIPISRALIDTFPKLIPSLTSSNDPSKNTFIRCLMDYSQYSQAFNDEGFVGHLTRNLDKKEDFHFDLINDKFSIRHYFGNVTYSANSLVDEVGCKISDNLTNLFKLPPSNTNPFLQIDEESDSEEYCSNPFIIELINFKKFQSNPNTTLLSTNNEEEDLTLQNRRISLKPKKIRNSNFRESMLLDTLSMNLDSSISNKLTEFDLNLKEIIETVECTEVMTIFCISPDKNHSKVTNREFIEKQLEIFCIPEICGELQFDFPVYMDQIDFLNHYNPLFQQLQYNNQSWQNSGIEIRYYLNQLGLKSSLDFLLGNQKIFLKFSVWDKLELELRYLAKLVKNNPEQAEGNGEKGLFGEEGQLTEVPLKDGDNSRDLTLSPSTSAQDTLRGSEPLEKEITSRTTTQRPKTTTPKPVKPPTMVRRWWVRLTWLMTWWIPTIWISRVLKKSRKDQQMAWREKVAICELIFLSWVIILFVNIGLGLILCPPNKVWTVDEVRTLQGEEDLGVYMRGIVYDIAKFAKSGHGKDWQPQGVDPDIMYEFGGKDVSTTFPIPLFVGCSGLVEDQQFQLKRNLTDDTAADMIFVHTSGPRTQFAATDMEDPTWYFTKVLPKLKTMKKGEVVWSYKNLYDMRTDGNRQVGIINDKVYDLTTYFETVSQPEYKSRNSTIKAHFLPDPIEQMFGPNSKQQDPELTRVWNNNIGLNDMERKLVMNCLNNQFYIGKVDKRQTFRCQFTNYLLLSFSVFVLSVTLVKFLAALQLTSKKDPGEGEKFVICQIPCYTENEESIRASLDSIAELKYDHRRKLMFIITDGMVIGSGCDKSTPDILCEILGIEKPDFETNCKYFESVGEGKKQHNRGVVYSGLYQSEGSSVPYLLVVKVGRPDERLKPGNRGKRDSQIVLMRFLNRVHFDTPMWPLEIEMYHHIKNIIGVDPKLYEYVLMVDADTRVLSDSLTRLISTMQRDNRIAGLCGETQLENENDSFTTMIQIYEYYISHHLSKAFESLFGTVTCLPGCFCMYRIRSVKNAPLLISDKVIQEYSRSDVNTLHLKNLLWLGEDRYLTTLMMKYFPNYKLKFTPDAKCLTVAPHKFNVLLSQRRRWINSTIHNLLELVMLKDMCGFCCFSMRFVVLLDLMGTLILPATVFYLAYIIIAACVGFQYISNLSLIIMGSIYILQALIFILKHQWQHIGWMIFYLVGMPLFNVFIPMYSYWHLDDFSWGNTRQVMGDGKLVEIDEDETDGNDTGDLEKNGFTDEKDWYTYDAEPITWQEYQIQQQALEMGMSPRQLQSQLEAQSTINLYKSEASLANPYQSAISLVQQPSQIHPAHGSQVYMMNNPSMPALSGDASRHLLRSASPPENAPSYSTSNLLPLQMQSNISYQNIASVTNLDLNGRAPSSAKMPQFYQQPQNLSMPHYDEYHANLAHGALSANHLPYNHGMHGSTTHLPSPLSPNMLRSRSQQGVNFNHPYPSQYHQAPRTVSHSRKSSLGTINEPQGFDRFRQISTTQKGGKKMPMNKKLESNSGLNLMRANTTVVTRHALQSASQINPIKLEGLKSMTEQAPALTDREKEAQEVIDNVMNDAEQIEDPDISCDEIDLDEDEE